MNPYIDQLYSIARKDARLILGLMSGTSLDGLDIALCRISGSGMNTRLGLERSVTIPYPSHIREEIGKVFAKPVIDFQLLCTLNPYIGSLHAGYVLDTLASWKISPGEIDLIASHGQTVFHAPRSKHCSDFYPDATLQIGDGDHIAVRTGIITLSDFRQKHVAAGGEGAPLAVYGDFLLFSSPAEDRILLNLGGIANFTYLPASLDPAEVFTTDTGPANTLMDAYCRRYAGRPYDHNGALAARGTPSSPLLQRLLENDFFRQPLPKSTGPELFNMQYLEKAQEDTDTRALPPEDILATLAHLTARSVTEAIAGSVPADRKKTLYVSGGGADNPFLCSLIQAGLGKIPLEPVSRLGIPADAKEAVLFAVLANEAVAAPVPALQGKQGLPAVSLGKISFPG